MWNAFVNYFSPQNESNTPPESDKSKDGVALEGMEAGRNPRPSDFEVEDLDLDNYNDDQARLRVNVSWLLSKAYGKEDIPEDLRHLCDKPCGPTLIVPPHLAGLMVSGEVYLKVCTNIFAHWTPTQSGHWAVIECLSKRGLYIVGTDDSAVTETDLRQTTPVLMPSHMALTETLMQAYTKEVVTIERIVQAVRRFTTFNASSELPYDLEDALLFWVNKVCATARHRLEKETKALQQSLLHNNSPQKVRINKSQLVPKDGPFIPVMDDLMKDLSDGCCIAVLVNFYCPQCLRFADLALKKTMGFADSVHNFKLVQRFCDTFLPTKCFNFQFEDLVHGHSFLKSSLLAFLSELFYYFEVSRLDIVEVNKPMAEKGLKASSVRTVPTGSPIPISSVTKRSFQSSSSSHPEHELTNALSPSLTPRQPLLQKRLQQAGTPSSPSHVDDGLNLIRPIASYSQGDVSAVLSRVEPPSSHTGLLSKAEIDPDMAESLDSDCVTSMDIHMVESGDDSVVGVSGEMQLESVSSFHSARTNNPSQFNDYVDHLMPAALKPAKEKSNNNHSKDFERGDSRSRRQINATQNSADTIATSSVLSSQQRSSDSDTLTNVSSDLPPGVELSVMNSSSLVSNGKIFAPVESVGDSVQISSSFVKPTPVAASFTIPDHPHSPDSARALGIPVVGESDLQKSRDIAESPFEHIESSKIYADQNGSENEKYREKPSPQQPEEQHRPDSLLVPKPIVISKDTGYSAFIDLKKSSDLKPSPTTNFAEIKRWREGLTSPVNSSGFVYVQHGDNKKNEDDKPDKISLREEFERKKKHGDKPKKTTFSPLPNQTTWQESAKKSAKLKGTTPTPSASEGIDTIQPLVSELASVRMHLEQKRRALELDKHRMETKLNKQRQRVGKAAFMHVLSKGKPDEKQTAPPQAAFAETSRPSSTPLPNVTTATANDVKPKSMSPHLVSASPQSVAVPSPQRVAVPSSHPVAVPVPSQRPEVIQAHPTTTVSPRNVSTPPNRPLSRQYIQETIDSVKQKWLASEPLVLNTRVPEVHSELQPCSEGGSPRSVGSDDYEEYNHSLEKLNHSLSELQGEIMRLSLQQEQIKNMAAADSGLGLLKVATGPVLQKTTAGPVVNHTPTGPIMQRRSPRYHRQHSADAIPPPVSPMHLLQQAQGTVHIHNPALAEHTLSPLVTSDPLHSDLRHSDQPFVIHPGSSPYDMARSSFSDSGLYMPPSQHSHNLSSSYHQSGSSHSQQPFVLHTQSLSPPSSLSQQQSPSAGMISVSSPLHSSPAAELISPPQRPILDMGYGHTTYTLPSQTAAYGYSTYTTPNQPPAVSSQYTPSLNSEHYEQFSDPSAFTPITPLATTYNQAEPVSTTPLPEVEPHVNNEGNDSFTTNDASGDSPAVNQQNTSADDRPLNAGFFVSFGDEEDTPVKAVKAKPKRKTWDKQKAKAENKSSPEDASPMVTKDKLQHSPVKSRRPFVPSASGDSPQKVQEVVGFVVGDDERSLDATAEIDIQKKREKLMLLQLKRKEEMEKKRLKKEAELAQKREDQRLKQLEAEQKKADDKMRREAIYQQYLNRKDDEDSPRQQKPSRPKSSKQKPSNTNGKNSNGSASQSQTDGNHFSHGGLTHRAGSPVHDRPQLTSRKPSSMSSGVDSGGSDAGSATSDYLGPKLFVKPSAKSNRHIIINAISHCCLAGSVNDDLKAKVLEEVAKSDEKHFVILFRDRGQKYRAVYSFCPDREEVLKLHGTGPKQITTKMFDRYFKYNSGGKSFNEIESIKHLSVSIDAVTIKESFWAKKSSATTARKPGGMYR